MASRPTTAQTKASDEQEPDPPPFEVDDEVEVRARGKTHWFPAVCAFANEDGTYDLAYTDGYLDLHLPPPGKPLTERFITTDMIRSADDHRGLSALFAATEGKDWKRQTGWDPKEVPYETHSCSHVATTC